MIVSNNFEDWRDDKLITKTTKIMSIENLYVHGILVLHSKMKGALILVYFMLLHVNSNCKVIA